MDFKLRTLTIFLTLLSAFAPGGMAFAQSACSSVFLGKKTEGALFHIINSKENPDREHQKLANRGLFAAKLSYLERHTLTNRKSVWDLPLAQKEASDLSSSVDYVSWVSQEKAPLSEVADSIVLDSKNSPRGLGHPLLRVAADILGMADRISEPVAKEVYGSVVIWYDIPVIKLGEEAFHLPALPGQRSVLIGRLFLAKDLSLEEKNEFYRRIGFLLKSKNVDEIFIEVADPSHVALYKRAFGFETVQKFSGEKYQMDDLTIMKTSLATYLMKVGVHSP